MISWHCVNYTKDKSSVIIARDVYLWLLFGSIFPILLIKYFYESRKATTCLT
jgi:hypothetical protein